MSYKSNGFYTIKLQKDSGDSPSVAPHVPPSTWWLAAELRHTPQKRHRVSGTWKKFFVTSHVSRFFRFVCALCCWAQFSTVSLCSKKNEWLLAVWQVKIKSGSFFKLFLNWFTAPSPWNPNIFAFRRRRPCTHGQHTGLEELRLTLS